MATYAEIRALPDNSGWGDLVDKIVVATLVKATAIIDEATPTQSELDWAKEAIGNPITAANDLIWYVIGSNKSSSVSAILSAGDSTVQNNVDSAVDAIYGS